MLELKSKELELKFNGEPLKMRFPTVHELDRFVKADGEDLEKIKKLFLHLGMPEEVFLQLLPEHLEQIMEKFQPPKK